MSLDEATKELAQEEVFEAITIYLDRSVAAIKGRFGAKMTDEQFKSITPEDFMEALSAGTDEAILFYEDEAGGSFDLSHIDADMPTMVKIHLLPLPEWRPDE